MSPRRSKSGDVIACSLAADFFNSSSVCLSILVADYAFAGRFSVHNC
jgi:hypothetical protein